MTAKYFSADFGLNNVVFNYFKQFLCFTLLIFFVFINTKVTNSVHVIFEHVA